MRVFRVFAVALCLLAATACRGSGASSPPAAPAASVTTPTAAGVVTSEALGPNGRAATGAGFRLGTAAKPFGWATAIADLDGDGKADFVIADRLYLRAAGSRYQLQFQLSNTPSQTVTFQSPHDALRAEIHDIDDDGDVDVVVIPALTFQVVRIWLNDGTGHFEEGDLQDFPSELPPLRTLAPPRTEPPQEVAGAAGPRPLHDLDVAARLPTAPTAPRNAILCLDARARGLPRLTSLSPRAPPASTSLRA